MASDRVQPFSSVQEAAHAARHGMEMEPSGSPAHRLLERLLATLCDAEERAEALARRAAHAEGEAAVDPLTGIASRRQWERTLRAEQSRSQRRPEPICVLAIDLDGLKHLNDTAGHRAGDVLLSRTGETLSAVCRASDTAARVGGDEFAVLALDTDMAAGRALVRRLGSALERQGIRASIGLAEHEAGSDLSTTWHTADARMYACKRRRAAPARAGRPGRFASLSVASSATS